MRLLISVGIFIKQVIFFDALSHTCLAFKFEALLTGLLGLLLEVQIFVSVFHASLLFFDVVKSILNRYIPILFAKSYILRHSRNLSCVFV